MLFRPDPLDPSSAAGNQSGGGQSLCHIHGQGAVVPAADANSDAHEVADTLLRLGYVGDLKIHYLHKGDPADGLDGNTAIYDWGEKARFVLSAV